MKNPVNKRNKKYDGIPYSERKRRFIGITCATLKKQAKKRNIFCLFFLDFRICGLDNIIQAEFQSNLFNSNMRCA